MIDNWIEPLQAPSKELLGMLQYLEQFQYAIDVDNSWRLEYCVEQAHATDDGMPERLCE